MDNKETSETLGEGFMVSKLSQVENPCDKILEKGKSVCMNNLEVRLAADDYSLASEINHVDLANKFGSKGVEESVVFDGIGGSNLMDNESLVDYPEAKLSVLTRGNDVDDGSVIVLEKNLEFCGNVDVCIDKVDEPSNKCSDTLHSDKLVEHVKVDECSEHVLHPHKPGSPTNLEVSGNCINLFVEVFGPLNGISENIETLDDKREVDHKLGESESSQEYSLEENGTLSPGIKDDSCRNEHECTFNSGDMVWVKTRNQAWWPGMVSQSKNEKGVTFLVKYYGNPSFVWSKASDLKPFIEYFEQISGQNSSRSFCASVEKALCEIGQRVKSKITCACFTKESQIHDEETSVSADKDSKIDVLTMSQLEPRTFYATVKHLACSINAPGQIELMVLKNCLSSFYCSVGHLELPLELLSTDGDHNNTSGDGGDVTRARKKKRNHSGLVLGDETASSTKGFESRERKKSKYLSYPYVDVIHGLKVSSTVEQEKDDPKSPSNLNANVTPLSSCSGKKSRKKGSKKPLEHHVVSKANNMDAGSSELLAELFSTARDCFNLEGSKYSDSLKRFYSGFRKFAFLDADIACKEAGKKSNSAKAVKKEGVEVVKKSKNKNLNVAPVKESVENVGGSHSKEGVQLVKKSRNKSVNLASVKESVENVGASQSKEGVEVVKKSKKKTVNLASVEENVENAGGSKSTNTDNPHGTENVKKRARKKKHQGANTQNELEEIRVVKEAENQKLNNASTEGSVENTLAEKFSKTDNPQGSGKAEQNKGKGHVIPSNLESTQNTFSIGTKIFHNSSGMISFQQARSNVPVSGTTPEKTEGVTRRGFFTNMIVGLPDLNGDHPSFSSEHIPVGEPSRKLSIFPNITGVNQTVSAPVSSSKDALQNTPQASNSVNGPNLSQSEDLTATESGSNVTNTGISPFAHYTLKMGIFGSAGTSEPRKRKRKEKTAQPASSVPDLNGNLLNMNSSGNSMPEGSQISPESEPPKKRVNKSDIGPDGEPLCGNVLLNFAPGSTLPSLETLVATFSRFGLLKESELQFLSDSSVQIVYERTSDARFAFRSLEKGHSFGESLVSFTTDCMPPPTSVKKRQQLPILPTSAPIEASKNQTKPTEMPNIAFMKQNVEMMKMTLEKSGDSLSPEVKAKLENEIKVFLEKLNSMTASSSA